MSNQLYPDVEELSDTEGELHDFYRDMKARIEQLEWQYKMSNEAELAAIERIVQLEARLADREDLLRHIRSKRTVHPCPGCCDTDRLIDAALKGERDD